MNFVKWTEAVLLSVSLIFGFASFSNADETLGEKTKETASDVKKGTKKAWREVKDETCEMVNGKMKCVGKKIKHAAQNAGDKVEDAVD